MKRLRSAAAVVVAVLLTGLLTGLSGTKVHAGENNPAGAPEHWHTHEMGSQRYWMGVVDRLEYGNGDSGNSRLWDAQAWYGGDYHKLWLKTEGEGPTGKSVETAELQALYSNLFSPFWSWQAGIRHDVRPSQPDVSYAVIGVQGLAPQWFETDVSLFLSDNGHLSLRGEFEYDLLLTQRLVLQPRLEINASASDARRQGLGSGLNSTQAGLRLRYEITREFAPYVGIRWEKRHGDTRDLARASGEPATDTSLVVGLRAWF